MERLQESNDETYVGSQNTADIGNLRVDISRSRVKKFWSKIVITSDCWIWTGWRTANNGYGMFWIGDRDIGAHRYGYLIHFGNIPEDMCVCHKCDNPSCVNPNHLFLGTNQDNEDDKVSKNRQALGNKNGQSGTKNWKNKLSEKDILELRRLYSMGNISQLTLSKIFSVTQSMVSRIVNNKSWKWVD